jgi:predicted dehydrogenase
VPNEPINVALLGSKFMGRAHSNAWIKAPLFFDLPRTPALHTVCARNAEDTEAFAARWGWENWTTRWQEAVTDPEVDLVDIGTPNDVHRDQALAALDAGKDVACEKPLARTLDEAREMARAASRSDAATFVWFTYRRVPAVALAHQLVQEGRLGTLRHIRAAYLQDWAEADVPLLWRFQAKKGGSGALGDIAAHIIDMARFITGDEIAEVTGSIEERFIKQRPLVDDPDRLGRSTVDDAVLFVARMRSGAIASFDATRLATGWRNSIRMEMHGDRGALGFDFADNNYLNFYDRSLPKRLQGWRRIYAAAPQHPYGADDWWPDGHGLGYEHTFVNQAADIALAVAGKQPQVPLPDFQDAYQTQRVMEAVVESARSRSAVRLSQIK